MVKIVIVFMIVVLGGYLAETRLLVGTRVAWIPQSPADSPVAVPFNVAKAAKYSMVIYPTHEDGKRARMALSWEISSNWGVVFQKNLEKTPRSGVRYIRFEPEEPGAYLLTISPVSGMGQLDEDTIATRPVRLDVEVRENDRRIIMPWVYWISGL